jgi:hypothetical protein
MSDVYLSLRMNADEALELCKSWRRSIVTAHERHRGTEQYDAACRQSVTATRVLDDVITEILASLGAVQREHDAHIAQTSFQNDPPPNPRVFVLVQDLAALVNVLRFHGFNLETIG